MALPLWTLLLTLAMTVKHHKSVPDTGNKDSSTHPIYVHPPSLFCFLSLLQHLEWISTDAVQIKIKINNSLRVAIYGHLPWPYSKGPHPPQPSVHPLLSMPLLPQPSGLPRPSGLPPPSPSVSSRYAHGLQPTLFEQPLRSSPAQPLPHVGSLRDPPLDPNPPESIPGLRWG